MPFRHRNLIWYAFTEPAARQLFVDWEGFAQCVLAELRAERSRHLTDEPKYLEFVEDLQQASPEFNQWWSRHDVIKRAEWVKQLNHPTVGLLLLEGMTLQINNVPDIRIDIYTPAPDSETDAKLQKLMMLNSRFAKTESNFKL